MTRASAAWAATIAALLLSVVLIVFVLQNPTMVVIHFLGWSGSVAVGMAMLIAAVTGGLLVATIGVARLTQLRVRARRTRAVSALTRCTARQRSTTPIRTPSCDATCLTAPTPPTPGARCDTRRTIPSPPGWSRNAG